MENQQEVNQLSSKPISQEEPVKIQKPNNFLTILLSMLLFISLIIAGYFAYQIQKLVKELREFRNQELASPTPTFEPGTEPEQIPFEVLTKDWKTYKGSNFIFKYPKEWTMGPSTQSSNHFLSPDMNIGFAVGEIENKISVVSSDKFATLDDYLNKSYDNIETKEQIQIDGREASKVIFKNEVMAIFFSDDKKFLKFIRLSTDVDTQIKINDLMIFDQILSTFKFTN